MLLKPPALIEGNTVIKGKSRFRDSEFDVIKGVCFSVQETRKRKNPTS